MIGEPVGRRPNAELYRRVNGVAVIPVIGTLVNRGVAIGEDSSGFTSYESIGVQIDGGGCRSASAGDHAGHRQRRRRGNRHVRACELLQAARAQKPITAVVDDMAASAAYGIASSATEIVVSPTSIAGSIGVVLMHLDKSAEMEMKGRKPTLIYAGAHKVDGNPFGPLSNAVRGDLQREVDTFYARFVDQVAAGRPKLTGEAIRATEARIFIGSEAIDVGLADRMGTFGETLARLSSAIIARTKTGDPLMSNDPNPDMIARAEHDAAITAARNEARAEGNAEGMAAGRAEGSASAIDRVRAILTCPEAEGRAAQAMVFALDSDMSPEIAAKALAASPAAAAAVPPLDARATGARVDSDHTPTPAQDVAPAWDRALRRAGAKLPATA